jgi:oxygen-independent coproporphyrinogen-3 oxidase
MAGIYIHVPFCKTKCHYCDFFSLATIRYRDEFFSAVLKEIGLRKDYLEVAPVETIYFGGGTPSLLQITYLREILDTIRMNFLVTANAEITLEANPDDLSPDYLSALHDTGINRLSIGIQSFRGQDLASLNRVHNENQAIRCITDARAAGFENLSIDLMYGIPGLDLAAWQSNLDRFLSLEIPHLSAYWLTIEAGTALAGFIKKGKYPSPDEAAGAAHFKYLMDWAETNGYDHYEVSNYARPGHYSRHNTAYWNGIPYLGLGPSAHSYNGINRQWNVSNLSEYLKGLEEGTLRCETEIITGKQRYNEYLMTSLRTQWGCDLDYLRRLHAGWAMSTSRQAQKYIEIGWIRDDYEKLKVTGEGWFHLDGITADLFMD